MNPVLPQTQTRRHAQIAFICFCVIFAVIAIITNGYFRALNSDEAKYYAPAITFVSHSLPTFPLRDYPFPGPPLALWAQALVATIFGGLTSVRFFSSMCSVSLAAYFLLRAESKRRIPALGIVAILTFPFFLWNAFTIKQHAFTVCCLLIGLDRWCKAEEVGSNRSLRSSILFLTAATLSNQFCAPLCAALCFDRLVRIRSLSRAAKAGALFSLLPLVCLGLLMLYWGGKQPPAYIDPLPSAISIGWRSRLAQFALGAISVGAWVGALLFEYRLHKRSFFLALIPSVFVVWLSRLYSPSGLFWTVGQGPISKVLFALFGGTPLLMILVSGALAALAVSFWVSPKVDAPWAWRCRILIAAYLAVTTFAVPYLFESYYLLLIIPLLFVILRNSNAFTLNRVRVSIQLGAIVCSGIAYSIFKLKQVG